MPRNGKPKDKEMEDGDEENLDIATTLKTVSDSLVSLQAQMTGVHQSIKQFNNRLDDKLGELTSTVADNVKATFEPQLDYLRETVNCLSERVDTMEQDLGGRLQKVEESIDTLLRKSTTEDFNPDVSVIMFGIPTKEDEDIIATVTDLFVNMLKVGVTIVKVERAGSRDGKPGAVRVELDSLYEKKQVLRAKHMCKTNPKSAKVRIRGCESHQDRVNRLNCTYMLKLMGKGEEHFVVGNGVISQKLKLKRVLIRGPREAPMVRPSLVSR